MGKGSKQHLARSTAAEAALRATGYFKQAHSLQLSEQARLDVPTQVALDETIGDTLMGVQREKEALQRLAASSAAAAVP